MCVPAFERNVRKARRSAGPLTLVSVQVLSIAIFSDLGGVVLRIEFVEDTLGKETL